MAGPVGTARAEDVYYLNQSQSGFNLPGVSLPQGQDEVHAADGTTCRSAVGGSGAYLDIGAINSGKSSGDIATYGRIVIPIGRKSSRLNCDELYRLEVERLKMELELLKMGMRADTTVNMPQPAKVAQSNVAPAPAPRANADWAKEGWSNGR
nr:hypothetical protein [Consotaella salsifontis]